MLIGVPAETAAGESRVAATPETVKKLVAQGHAVRVQSGAGLRASVTDEPPPYPRKSAGVARNGQLPRNPATLAPLWAKEPVPANDATQKPNAPDDNRSMAAKSATSR